MDSLPVTLSIAGGIDESGLQAADSEEADVLEEDSTGDAEDLA
jgi:hypothetical protein